MNVIPQFSWKRALCKKNLSNESLLYYQNIATHPLLHFPHFAFFVAVQGLMVSSFGSQTVHGLHDDISCLSEQPSPFWQWTHSTLTSAVIREPHCGTRPWPAGHSGQLKHSLPVGFRIVIWFHLQLLPCSAFWADTRRIIASNKINEQTQFLEKKMQYYYIYSLRQK